MTSQGTLMAESATVDGAQERSAEDVRASNSRSAPGFGNNASGSSDGSGSNIGAEASGCVAEDGVNEENDGKAEKPTNWSTMTKTQRRNWHKRTKARQEKQEE